MIPQLRPYQIDTVERTAQSLRNGSKVVVIQANCGAGKTTIAAEITRRAVAKGKKVVEIVHRRRLVDQFSQRLLDFEIDHGTIMRGVHAESAYDVQVTSKDTLISRAVTNNYINLPKADLLIVDEGRHCRTGETYRNLVQHYRDQGSHIILLDATPSMPDGSGLGPWVQDMIVAAKTTELIKDGYLLPVKCFAPDRTGPGKKKVRGIAGHLVDSWKQFAQGLPTVAFFSRVQHSQDAVKAFLQEDIKAIHVDADTPDNDRDQIFIDMEKGKYQVLCNVGVVAEGTDIPCLGCAQFYMDPSSRTGFLQRAGRVMRPHPGQQYGIVIDHAGAIFRHGFPDEDTEWKLDGNTDQNFIEKHQKDQTEKAFYCGKCSLIWKGQETCPQCGEQPVKAPRSIFAAPEIVASNEMLLEAERVDYSHLFSQEEKKKHWLRCLAVAKARHGSFGMAAQIYKQKYKTWPEMEFPCYPPETNGKFNWKMLVIEAYPNFGRRK